MKNYAIVESGFVTNIVLWDGDSVWSPGEGKTAIEVKDGVDAGIGYSFVDGVFTAPEIPTPSQEELVSEAEKKKSQILQSINETTQTWQTQLALGIITDADKATLTLWMEYAQEVQAIDTSKAPDIDWPIEP
ncbi:tail fiber assembly protein [Rahnella bonaserana]